MQVLLKIALNLTSLAISIGLIYFALRLMHIFKGSAKEKPIRYICAGVLTTTISLALFSLSNIRLLPNFIHLIGMVTAVIGGGLVLVGLHKEYKIWTSH
jgi:uncharacterized membrane protein YecN with MAPEG domain